MALGKLFCFMGPQFPPMPKVLPLPRLWGGLSEILHVKFKLTNLLIDSLTSLSSNLQHPLPSSSLLADDVASQFTEKMEAIRREPPRAPVYLHLCSYSPPSLLYFDERSLLLSKANPAMLDPFPYCQLKDVDQNFSPFFLTSSLFPSLL